VQSNQGPFCAGSAEECQAYTTVTPVPTKSPTKSPTNSPTNHDAKAKKVIAAKAKSAKSKSKAGGSGSSKAGKILKEAMP